VIVALPLALGISQTRAFAQSPYAAGVIFFNSAGILSTSTDAVNTFPASGLGGITTYTSGSYSLLVAATSAAATTPSATSAGTNMGIGALTFTGIPIITSGVFTHSQTGLAPASTASGFFGPALTPVVGSTTQTVIAATGGVTGTSTMAGVGVGVNFTINGEPYTAAYLYQGADGTNVAFSATKVAPVAAPEPGSLALAGLGLLLVRKRRMKSK
jgi:hypothetical protein